MIATAKSISYSEAKAEYDDNRVINGVKVASEAARQNVYGDNCREVVEEMRDTQRIHSPVKESFPRHRPYFVGRGCCQVHSRQPVGMDRQPLHA